MTDEEIQEQDDILITNDVARAIEEDELIAFYQPLVDLESRAVVGAEALVRWTIPDGTIVPAALFVPSLERTHTIYGLDWYMEEAVCSFLEAQANTPAYVPMSLNFSPMHAPHEPDFGRKVVDSGSWHGVAPADICVELAEAAVQSGDEALQHMVDSVIESGATMVIDNVQCGTQNLASYAERGVKAVKISASWWREQGPDELKALVACAGELGLGLSAEGVETEEDVQKLRAAGFTRAQGYYLGVPCSGESFADRCMQTA